MYVVQLVCGVDVDSVGSSSGSIGVYCCISDFQCGDGIGVGD